MPSPKRSLLVVALVVSAALAPTHAQAQSAFPPQLPSQQEMARLQEQAGASLGRLRSAQRELDSLVASFESAQTQLQTLNAEVSAAEAMQTALQEQLVVLQQSINDRAAAAYRFGPTNLLNVLLGARSFRQLTTAVEMFESVSTTDAQTLTSIRELRDEMSRLKQDLDGKKIDQLQAVQRLEERQRQMQSSLSSLSREYESIQSRIDSSRSGFAFPVRAPYSFVDTYGAPRAGYRRHQGVDIFAVAGTPLYAVVDGVIEDKGYNALGGNKLWLRSPGDGWRYYYAHLRGFAPGINNGTRVRKGQLIGYVGNTGNAITTPPHLHFEAHVPGGSSTNPYPILRRANLFG